MLEKLTDKTFKEKVMEAPGRAAVEFYADWCTFCRQQEAVSDRIMESGSAVPIYLMNGDEHPELVQKYDIMGYPTYILFENGEVIGRSVGAKPEQAVREFLAS